MRKRELVFLAVLGGCLLAACGAPVDGEADETPAEARQIHQAMSGEYSVVDCGANLSIPPGAKTCDVTSGSSGVLLQGNVLAPDTVYVGGEVLVDSAGIISCVGCDCSAGDPSIVTCPDGVISPGLINTHDHERYDHNPPIPHAARYDHRHNWRLGIPAGHDVLGYETGQSCPSGDECGSGEYCQGGVCIAPPSNDATTTERVLHELRMVLTGATASVSVPAAVSA